MARYTAALQTLSDENGEYTTLKTADCGDDIQTAMKVAETAFAHPTEPRVLALYDAGELCATRRLPHRSWMDGWKQFP